MEGMGITLHGRSHYVALKESSLLRKTGGKRHGHASLDSDSDTS